MYLQSAEILNFHGIRHLKIEFDPETSALIGENAWGKSSLLSALWMVLGQGSDKLCTFSKSDLYIPIRISPSHSTPQPSSQLASRGLDDWDSTSTASTSVNGTRTETASILQQANHNSQEHQPVSTQQTDSRRPSSSQPDQMSSSQLAGLRPDKVVTTKDYHRYYFSIPKPDGTGKILKIVDLPLEPQDSNDAASKSSKNSKASKSKHAASHKHNLASKSDGSNLDDTSSPAGSLQDVLSSDSLTQALNARDKESFFKALQDAQSQPVKGEGYDISAQHLMQRARNILDTADGVNEWTKAFAQADYDFFANDIYQAEADKIVIDLIFCESNFGTINNVERFATLRPACFYGEDGLYRVHYRITGQEAKLYVQNKSTDLLLSAQQSGTVVFSSPESASQEQPCYSGNKAQSSLISTAFQDTKETLPSTAFATTISNATAKAAANSRDSFTANSDSASTLSSALTTSNPILRAVASVAANITASDETNISVSATANTTTTAKAHTSSRADENVTVAGAAETADTKAATAAAAANPQTKDSNAIAQAASLDSHLATPSAQDLSTGTAQAGVGADTSDSAGAESDISQDSQSQSEAQSQLSHIISLEDIPDSQFVTTHELLDSKGRPIENSLEIIKDLIKLNPLLRLRDRRMLKLSEMEEAIQKSSLNSGSNEQVDNLSGSNGDGLNDSDFSGFGGCGGDCREETEAAAMVIPFEGQEEDLKSLNSLFASISQEDDLTCNQLNQGLAELNVIASKYLVNYRARNQFALAGQTKSRTAREIVNHPVSIETLNSLKQSLEDKRPSRSKFLMSLLAGAMLMNKGTQEIDPHSKPILVLEDIEGRFHPTLLLTLWSILDTIPVQKIVTTNSSALLSAMPMSNIRRLCRQYYDVRCYSISEHAFSADDERRIAFHIRISRPSAFFARCWILVEGETEVWILNEIAGILGMNLACEGVKTIEFAQCGLAPLIKLAKQLGISYYVLTDGDDAGKKYAQTVQGFTGSQHLSEHLSVIPHLDIEHYLYVSGYADVYQKAAGLIVKPKKNKGSRQELSNLLKQAQALVSGKYNEDSLAIAQSLEADPNGLNDLAASDSLTDLTKPNADIYPNSLTDPSSTNTANGSTGSSNGGSTGFANPKYKANFANPEKTVANNRPIDLSDTSTYHASASPNVSGNPHVSVAQADALKQLEVSTSQELSLGNSENNLAMSNLTSNADSNLTNNESYDFGLNTEIEADPVIEYLTLETVLHCLQRWYQRKTLMMEQNAPYKAKQGAKNAKNSSNLSYIDLNNLKLEPQEHAALHQVLVFACEFMNRKMVTGLSKEFSLGQNKSQPQITKQVQELTFDISQVTVAEINKYYEQAELNLRRSGGMNRKLTNKQRQALKRLTQEKAEVLYGLNLTNQVPKTKNLFKAKAPLTRKSRSNRNNKEKIRSNFTIPSALYNHLKRNFMQQHASKMSKLKQKVNGSHQESQIVLSKANIKLPQSLNKQDWLLLKKIISKLQSQHHKEEARHQDTLVLETPQKQAEALNILKYYSSAKGAVAQGHRLATPAAKTVAPHAPSSPHRAQVHLQGAQAYSQGAHTLGASGKNQAQTRANSAMQSQAAQHQAAGQPNASQQTTAPLANTEQNQGATPYSSSHSELGADHTASAANAVDQAALSVDKAALLSTESAGSPDQHNLSPKEWVNKIAQSELDNSQLLQTDIELSKAQLDPLDEAKVLKRARQRTGIKYGEYGAIDQKLLNKQGWTIDKIIDAAIHKKSKPGLAIEVIEAMQQRGKEAVPQMFRTMFIKIKRIAKSEFGL